MLRWHPRYIILTGFILVLLGFILPFLMTLRIVQPSLLLSFLSFAASFAGLLLGLVGAAMYRGRR